MDYKMKRKTEISEIYQLLRAVLVQLDELELKAAAIKTSEAMDALNRSDRKDDFERAD